MRPGLKFHFMFEPVLDFLIQYPYLLALGIPLSTYGLFSIIRDLRPRLSFSKKTRLSKKTAAAHHQWVMATSSDLLIQSSRLLDGEYAEASFLYHIWTLHQGNKNEIKDYEIRKLIEKAQGDLKMIYTSFNNLTLNNPALQKAGKSDLGFRWESLFSWIRGARGEILRMSETEIEGLFMVDDIPASESPELLAADVSRSRFLDIRFIYLKPKSIKSYEKGLLGYIFEIRKMIKEQINKTS